MKLSSWRVWGAFWGLARWDVRGLGRSRRQVFGKEPLSFLPLQRRASLRCLRQLGAWMGSFSILSSNERERERGTPGPWPMMLILVLALLRPRAGRSQLHISSCNFSRIAKYLMHEKEPSIDQCSIMCLCSEYVMCQKTMAHHLSGKKMRLGLEPQALFRGYRGNADFFSQKHCWYAHGKMLRLPRGETNRR